MVNKLYPKIVDETEGGPPPQDESWWGAILAEEESRPHTAASRSAHTPAAAVETPHNLALQNGVDWRWAQGQFECDSVVELEVVGHNRGGLLVNGEHLQGFVPISHLVKMPTGKTETDQEQFLASYLGQDLRLKIIECDQERGRVVFSERAALAEAGSRNLLLQRLRNGDCVLGTVTNITDFGIFVDLGGVEGLIHVSEISWGRVRHPSDVVTFGASVQVYVLGVDQDRARIALSLKRLTPNPWETAEERYYPGLVTEAVITSILPFGAFARLEEGLDGLIHVSEMGGEVTNPLETFQEGQPVRVRILHVDANRQRLGLSLNLQA
jgi:small subunit ribosomal protein S1